ncbi:hypothetical protein C3K47_09250 [Solitalea longa]|uniref:Lipoprotein n=1 Tax=Solitalea longa TaxID=2079460 RepID=A0A2S5A1U2_9SPHI|nr:hypothetical protein [Solitalea longa]POY36551.1 hypothetical protein C3K47_09250 [Solitalea longa]
MRFLLLTSSFFLLIGCSSAYKSLQAVNEGDASCLKQFKPQFSSALYSTHVNVVGKHLSGLLLIKKMPDSSKRMVFSNEMGVKFFDFEFAKDGSFKVHSILQQMNKKAVINTLRKDFEMVFMDALDSAVTKVAKTDTCNYYGYKQPKEMLWYITDSNCSKLVRIERATDKKPKVTAIMKNYVNGIPDTIGISHNGFTFNIGLKRIER